mmetsp:Transcript_23116/g.38029  ORF Transcript_23116/g.38029 Transcript_23116/m.38029 type:complete len:249 (+) Transcript_23116:26-772(+)
MHSAFIFGGLSIRRLSLVTIPRLHPARSDSRCDRDPRFNQISFTTKYRFQATERRRFAVSSLLEESGEGAVSSVTTVRPPVLPPVDVTRLDLRVGKVVKAWKHPEADSLYCEEIDVGEEQPRLICSGLVNYVPLDQFEGSMVIVLANLKPRKMRGIESNGMVLAASNPEHTQVELVRPPEGAVPGEKVTFEGLTGAPDSVLNPKKKIWEAVQPDLKVNSELQATYKGTPFGTSVGLCTVQTLANASIA